MNGNTQRIRKKRFWALFLALMMVMSTITTVPVKAEAESYDLYVIEDKYVSTLYEGDTIDNYDYTTDLSVKYCDFDGTVLYDENTNLQTLYTVRGYMESGKYPDFFSGWKIECFYKYVVRYHSGDGPDEYAYDLKLKAKPIDRTYNISYEILDEGVENPNKKTTYKLGEDPYTLLFPKKPGYYYQWANSKSEYEGTVSLSGDVIKKIDDVFAITGGTEDEGSWKLPILYGLFSKKSYNVAFKGETDNDDIYNNEIDFPNAPSKKGAFFEGWATSKDATSPVVPADKAGKTLSTEEFAKLISDSSNDARVTVNLYPVFTEGDTITLDTDGGTLEDPLFEKENDGSDNYIGYYYSKSADIELPVPTKNGYEFDGWYPEYGGSSTKPVEKIKSGTSGNIELKAKWTPEYYKLSLYSRKCEIEDSTEYTLEPSSEQDSNYSKYYSIEDEFDLPTPTRNGYTFLGWFKEVYGAVVNVVKVAKIVQGTSGDIDLAAHWKATDYTLTLDADGGEIAGEDYTRSETGSQYTRTYDIEDEFELPTPARRNYAFDGWYEVVEGTEDTTDTKEIKESTGNRTFKAHWTRGNTSDYTVEFYYQQADGSYQTTPSDSELRTAQTDREVYVSYSDRYDRQYEDPNLGFLDYTLDMNQNNVFIGTATADDKLTLKLYFKIQLSVQFYPGDHAVETESTKIEGLDHGSDMPKAPEYTAKTGYKRAEQAFTPELPKKVTGNASYVANWEPIAYKLTLDADGGEIEDEAYSKPEGETIYSRTYSVEDEVTLPTPKRDGAFFLGWYQADGQTKASDVIDQGTTGDISLKAKWSSVSVQIEGWKYGETANKASVIGNEGFGDPVFTYYKDETCKVKTDKASGASSEGGVPGYAGTYYVKAYFQTEDVSSFAKKFEIERAQVTVKADDKTQTEGQPDPKLTATVSGLINGDAETLISYQLTRTAGVTPGSYDIIPTGDAIQGNYNVSFVKGTLTIAADEKKAKAEEDNKKSEAPQDDKEKAESKEAKVGDTFEDERGNLYSVISVNKKSRRVSFKKCKSGINAVTVPETVQYKGNKYTVTLVSAKAFAENTTIKKVKISGKVKTIEKEAFYKCKKLVTVSIKDGVTQIGDRAFYGCASLKTITFPASTTRFGNCFIGGCLRLKTVKIKSLAIKEKGLSSKSFSGIKKTLTICVKENYLKVYRKLFKKKGLKVYAKFKKI